MHEYPLCVDHVFSPAEDLGSDAAVKRSFGEEKPRCDGDTLIISCDTVRCSHRLAGLPDERHISVVRENLTHASAGSPWPKAHLRLIGGVCSVLGPAWWDVDVGVISVGSSGPI